MKMHSIELNDRIRNQLSELRLVCSSDQTLISLLEECIIEIDDLNGRIDVLEQECHWLNNYGVKK